MKPSLLNFDLKRVSLAKGVDFSKRVLKHNLKESAKHNSERNFFGNLFAKKGDILK